MKWSTLLLALSIVSCSDSTTSPERRDFNLKFSYGVNAKNVLNTYDNTLTKDLFLYGTITIPFIVSDNDLERIKAKMLDIGFDNYPDTLEVPHGDTIVAAVTPYHTYIFDVTNGASVKHFQWSDGIVTQDIAAARLKDLIALIESIIESNPQYSQLPPVKGGYI